MSSVSQEQIAAAKKMDLLTYLQTYEPAELVRCGNSEYSTKTHSSLKISKGLWIWNKHQIGGRSALDYLVKVKGMGFVAAVEQLCNTAPFVIPVGNIELETVPFELPPKNPRCTKVISYLKWRGIDEEILQYCVDNNLLYETVKEHKGNNYYNCVFVGKDIENVPRYAMLRGTFSGFRGEVAGSDKRYSFSINPCLSITELIVCESAIDALSYATLQKQSSNANWAAASYLSLGGTSPVALQQYLQDHPKIQHITLALDNDEPGKNAAKTLMAELDIPYYSVCYKPPSGAKDYNELLGRKKKREKPKKEVER